MHVNDLFNEASFLDLAKAAMQRKTSDQLVAADRPKPPPAMHRQYSPEYRQQKIRQNLNPNAYYLVDQDGNIENGPYADVAAVRRDMQGQPGLSAMSGRALQTQRGQSSDEVDEALKFHGGIPDVDHMPGPTLHMRPKTFRVTCLLAKDGVQTDRVVKVQALIDAQAEQKATEFYTKQGYEVLDAESLGAAGTLDEDDHAAPQAFRTKLGDLVRVGSIDFLFAREDGQWYARRNDYRVGHEIPPQWRRPQQVPDYVRAALDTLPQDDPHDLDEGNEPTSPWSKGYSAGLDHYKNRSAQHNPYKSGTPEYHEFHDGFEEGVRDSKDHYSEGIEEEAPTSHLGETHYDTDQILYYLTAAFRELVKYREHFMGFENMETVYETMRMYLKDGDYAGFSNAYDRMAARYPDAFDELMNEAFAAAGLDERTATIEQFLEKCGKAEQVNEISTNLAQKYMGKAIHSTLTGKKDRNPGIKKAISRMSGTHKPILDPKKYPTNEDFDRLSQLLKAQLKK